MTYINQKVLKAILKEYSYWPISMESHLDMFDKINSLPSIDFEEIIEEMKNQELEKHLENVWDKEQEWRVQVLIELLEKLPK